MASLTTNITTESQTTQENNYPIHLFLVRHGDRQDYDPIRGPIWKKQAHHQKKGGDIASTLYWKLTICGYKVWQDIQMDEIDTTAMQEGIDNSHCFILLLTT